MKKKIVSESLAGLERLFVEILDEGGEGKYQHFFQTRSREGIFSPALVMWLMLCQRTQERHSLVGAIESLGAGHGDLILSRNPDSKRAREKKFSANSGGLSRARGRTSILEVRALSELVTNYLMKKYVKGGYWHGKRVYLVDGTYITLPHGEAIQKAFPAGNNQYRELHNSQILCLCMHDVFSGVAASPHFGPYRGSKATSEQELCKEMIDLVPF